MDESGEFDIRQPFTLESLQDLLDLYFPERKKRPDWTFLLFEELKENEIELWEILDHYMRVRDILPEMEKEEIERVNRPHILDRDYYEDIRKGEDWKGWAQVGIVRIVLDLSHDRYWNDKLRNIPTPEKHIEKINRWRKIISEKEK